MRFFWKTLPLILCLIIPLAAQAAEYKNDIRTTTIKITEEDRSLHPRSYAEAEFWEGFVNPNDTLIMVNITVIAIDCPDPLGAELEIGLREYGSKGYSTLYYDTELRNDSANPYRGGLVAGDHFEYAFNDNLDSEYPHVLKLGVSTINNADFTGYIWFRVGFQLSGYAYTHEWKDDSSFPGFEWFYVLVTIILFMGVSRRKQLQR